MADCARCAWCRVDRPRPRSTFSFLSFCFCTSLLWLRHFPLSAQVRTLLLSERMTVSVSFSRQSQTGVLQLLEPFFTAFFTGSRSEEEGAEAHGPEDRPSAGRSSFFLLPWNCLQFVLKAFSFSRQALLACCCNTPGIHNKLAGNESDRARTAVHRPRTRWSRF